MSGLSFDFALDTFMAYSGGAPRFLDNIESASGVRKARMRRELEKTLAIGNSLFQAIKLIERNWRAERENGATSYDPSEERVIAEYYRSWMVPCARILDAIAKFEDLGFVVQGADDFRRNYQETRLLAIPSTAIDRNEPITLRPVTVDAEGRIFLETGEQLMIPGLEAEKIRQSIADTASGRVYRIEAETRDEFLAKLDAICEDEGELPD